MNITLRISPVNFKNRLPQEVQVFTHEELQEFLDQGACIKGKKQYSLVIHHRQLTLELPILQMDDGNYQIIWPTFKLPNRPYSIEVYLYAAARYLSSEEGMRTTAKKVIQVFGLETFSHSTISRFLPRLCEIMPYLISYGAQIQKDWGVYLSEVIRRKHWDEAKYKQLRLLSDIINPVLRAPPEFGSWLAYRYWQDTQNFIV